MKRERHKWEVVEEPIEKCIHCGCFRRRRAASTFSLRSYGAGKWLWDYSMPHCSKWSITLPECV